VTILFLSHSKSKSSFFLKKVELFLAPKVQEPALFHLPAGCGIVPFILESLIFHSRRVFSCDPGSKFHIVTNIRHASVTDEIGIVCLELQGGQPFLQGQDNIHQHFGMAAGQGQEFFAREQLH
jgi:hypothetical protein